nr:hypothetical protein [Amycolatopsis orientalis]
MLADSRLSALIDAAVVVRAEPREHGELLAAQPGYPPRPGERLDPRLRRGQAVPPRTQESPAVHHPQQAGVSRLRRAALARGTLARERILNWADFAAAAVGSMRYEVGRHPGDRRLAALVAELRTANPDVARWWDDHGVTDRTSVSKRIEPDGPTARNLPLLASWEGSPPAHRRFIHTGHSPRPDEPRTAELFDFSPDARTVMTGEWRYWSSGEKTRGCRTRPGARADTRIPRIRPTSTGYRPLATRLDDAGRTARQIADILEHATETEP